MRMPNHSKRLGSLKMNKRMLRLKLLAVAIFFSIMLYSIFKLMGENERLHDIIFRQSIIIVSQSNNIENLKINIVRIADYANRNADTAISLSKSAKSKVKKFDLENSKIEKLSEEQNENSNDDAIVDSINKLWN